MKPAIRVCERGGDGDEDFNVAGGYSLHADRAGIRAEAVTSRCVACGRLGYRVDWMVRTGDMQLLNLAESVGARCTESYGQNRFRTVPW